MPSSFRRPPHAGGDRSSAFQTQPRKEWAKPDGDPKAPPVEEGQVVARLDRVAWNGGPSTSVHLTVMKHESSGAIFGRAQVWRQDSNGGWWPNKAEGVTIRRAEVSAWSEFLQELQRQLGEVR